MCPQQFSSAHHHTQFITKYESQLDSSSNPKPILTNATAKTVLNKMYYFYLMDSFLRLFQYSCYVLCFFVVVFSFSGKNLSYSGEVLSTPPVRSDSQNSAASSAELLAKFLSQAFNYN